MDNNKNKCCTGEHEAGEGISLLTRVLPLLDPAKAPLDPNSTQDILVFAKHYANLVRYYDTNDSIDWVDFEKGVVTKPCDEIPPPPKQGDQQKQAAYASEKKKELITWKEFFYKDIAVVVASVSRWRNKLYLINEEYNDLRKRTERWPNEQNFRKLFLTIIHHLKRIDRWYERSVDGHPLRKELKVKIESFLQPALKQLMAYDKGMILTDTDDLDLVTQYETFKKKPWSLTFDQIKPDDSVYVGNNQKQQIIYALMYVDDVFNTMYRVYEEITARSAYYWEQAIQYFPAHQPHMALFIAFVELLSFVKKDLNGLTGRHLDFFYRDVLHLSEKSATPDSVYLIYELAKGVDEFELPAGTELSAGKDSLGKTLKYKSDKSFVINAAKVKELKTLFLDKNSPIKNMYAAPVANSADGKGEEFKEDDTSWPTFGYFEPREPGDEITGEKAEFGFAIASPQLKLGKSDRTITINIHVENEQKDTSGNQIPVILLPDDYQIYFSGEKEWIQPIVETTTTELELPSGKITVPQKTFEYLNNYLKKATETQIITEFGFKPALAKNLKEAGTAGDTLPVLKKIKAEDSEKVILLLNTFSNKYARSTSAGAVEQLFTFKSVIQPQQEAITVPGKDFKDFNFKTRYPVCKIIFDPAGERYDKLKDIRIRRVEITVDVKDLTDIIVENDNGRVDAENPFYPFSARPTLGSSFYLGAKEFEEKDISTLTANIEWMGNFKFAERYLGYVRLVKRSLLLSNLIGISPATPKCTAGFPATNSRMDYKNYLGKPYVFHEGRWKEEGTDIQLFNEDSDVINNSISWPLIKEAKTRAAQATEANHWRVAKLTLNTLDFGHEFYPTLVSQYLAMRKAIVEDGQAPNSIFCVVNAGDNNVFVPDTPAEVLVKAISVDYTSTQVLHNPNGQMFHIYPFGITEIYPFQVNTNEQLTPAFDKLLLKEKETDQLIIQTSYLFPEFKYGYNDNGMAKLKALNASVAAKYDDYKRKNYFQLNQYRSLTDQQGNLYIGIEGLTPPQNLSLLFKFADGTAYDNDSEPPTIHWSYLVNNEWLPIPQDHIITDSTYGFQTAGIILFDIPSDATNNNTILTGGLHWICASIDTNGERIPRLIEIIAQANQAIFYDQGNDPAHYDMPLPAETISKPVVKIPEVKVITQPFESFDGKPAETSLKFYQRVSERLRHKGRAITPSDYEHLVLEEFPSVYKVKVLSHNDPECLCRHYEFPGNIGDPEGCCCPQVAPGHVLVIAISNLRNKNAIDLLKPRTGRRTLIKIEEFLQKRVSPFVRVHAKNPKFEEIKVSFNVKFYSGIDKGFHLNKLNDDIIRFLTPWAYDSAFEILFGNKIYASEIIDFIEGLDYVDYITCFRMIHIVEGCCKDDSMPDMDCDEMHRDLGKLKLYTWKVENGKSFETGEEDDMKKLQDVQKRFLIEVSAVSPQAILVSAKHHCINLIEEEPADDECHCDHKE